MKEIPLQEIRLGIIVSNKAGNINTAISKNLIAQYATGKIKAYGATIKEQDLLDFGFLNLGYQRYQIDIIVKNFLLMLDYGLSERYQVILSSLGISEGYRADFHSFMSVKYIHELQNIVYDITKCDLRKNAPADYLVYEVLKNGYMVPKKID